MDYTRKFRTGVDMGTSRIVCARSAGVEFFTKSALNAYLQEKGAVPARQVLNAGKSGFPAISGVLEIDGIARVRFAQVYRVELKKTMRLGCLNSQDSASSVVLRRVTARLAESPQFPGSVLGCSTRSVPSRTAASSIAMRGLANQSKFNAYTLESMTSGGGSRLNVNAPAQSGKHYLTVGGEFTASRSGNRGTITAAAEQPQGESPSVLRNLLIV